MLVSGERRQEKIPGERGSLPRVGKTPIEQLKTRKEHLVSLLLKGKEDRFLERHTELLDEYFQESYANSSVGPRMHMEKNPCAFLALGGYGRREQCLHSDVDLLLLFKKKVPEGADELVRETVYPLWDIGLEVGHATRSLRESQKLATEEFEVLTSLMDARFLCGFSTLYSDLMQALRNRVLGRHARAFIQWLLKRNRERHEHFGDSTYLLEPDIKEGQGGLRDYHAMVWMALTRYQTRDMEELARGGHITEDELHALREALSFTWKVRNQLHHIAGRRCDRLYFEYQVEMARSLGFRDRDGRQDVEQCLGTLHGHMEFLKQLYLVFVSKVTPRRMIYFRKGPVRRLRTQGLRQADGTLNFQSPDSVLEQPLLLIRIFEQSVLLDLPLSIEAKRLVRGNLHLVDSNYQASQPVVQALRRIMTAPTPVFSVLKEMFNTGLMTSLIPELKGIVNLIQYDEYHLHPVDKHSLRSVQTLKDLGRPEPEAADSLAGRLYGELLDPETLIWAMFLHDAGKGVAMDDHAAQGARIARSVFSRMSFPREKIDLISFLVEEHLALMKYATQRDIQEEKAVVQFAMKFRSVEELKMLYLLTVADARATGPKAWSSWIDTLLKELFFKTRHILEKGELAATGSRETVEHKKRQVAKKSIDLPGDELDSLFEKMSPRYLLHTPSKEILKHIELFRGLGSLPFVLATHSTKTDLRTVTVCARDRTGLFSKIAGVLTLNSLSILDANIYTWGNQVALDIFTVKAPPDSLHEEETWERVKRDLHAALSGERDLETEVDRKMKQFKPSRKKGAARPDKIVVDNRGSDFFTIIEVYANNFPGLLYKITNVLFRCGMDVRIAKIATKVDQVLDIFYVRDFYGEKVDNPEQVEALRNALQEVLSVAT